MENRGPAGSGSDRHNARAESSILTAIGRKGGVADPPQDLGSPDVEKSGLIWGAVKGPVYRMYRIQTVVDQVLARGTRAPRHHGRRRCVP